MSHSNEPLKALSVRKSNDFIAAKYKSTLLENQVMAIALSRIEVNSKDVDAPLEARLYPGELKRLVSDPAHIYRDLGKLAKTITGHTMFLEDGKGNFKAFSAVPNAYYIDGVFIIKFNEELRDHVLFLENNYTSLELSVMTDFKKNSSFRLYEVLKKEVYKIPPKTKNNMDPYIEVEYNISELRFIIGLANSDDENVKRAMARMGKNIDWDEVYEKLDKKDKTYEEWRDFQRRVLKQAQEELKEKSDIRFEYSGLKEGRKTKRVLFKIYKNVPSNPDKVDERKNLIDLNNAKNRQYEMPYDFCTELYEEFVGHNNLSKEDIDLLLRKAGGDANIVRKYILKADQQPYIRNYMGWIVTAILEDYDETETIEGSAKRAKAANKALEEYRENKPIIANQVWEKIKTKEEFPNFIKAIEDGGIDLEQLEEIYTSEELAKAFINWNRTHDISFE